MNQYHPSPSLRGRPVAPARKRVAAYSIEAAAQGTLDAVHFVVAAWARRQSPQFV